MDGAVENANPTILSLADLPKRQSKKKIVKKGVEHQFDHIVLAKPDYLSPLYSTDDVAWFDDPLDDTNELTREPIDEQEIYGKPSLVGMFQRQGNEAGWNWKCLPGGNS